MLVAIAIAWPATALFLRRFTDTDVPWWDAFPTAASVVGQWLLGRKYVENWPVWIAVDVVGAALFAYKGLWLTTVLYAVFVAMAAVGWRSWQRRATRAEPARMSERGFVVALLGAESTGKTTLAAEIGAALAARGLRVAVVGEALREFCDANARTPRRDEQAAIAAAQSARIDAAAARHEIVVADTSALMIAVYSDFVFADASLYAERARRAAALRPDARHRARPALAARRPAARRRARARARRCPAALGARRRGDRLHDDRRRRQRARRGGAARDRRRAGGALARRAEALTLESERLG